MPQLWVVCTQCVVPKDLYIDGWNDDTEFLVPDEYTNHTKCTTMKKLYKRHNISLVQFAKFDRYKLSNNTDPNISQECAVCHKKDVPIYNLCEHHKHSKGCCKDCWMNCTDFRYCPICKNLLIKFYYGDAKALYPEFVSGYYIDDRSF